MNGIVPSMTQAKLRMHQTQLFWADWRQSDVIAEPTFLEHEPSPAVLLRFARRPEAGSGRLL